MVRLMLGNFVVFVMIVLLSLYRVCMSLWVDDGCSVMLLVLLLSSLVMIFWVCLMCFVMSDSEEGLLLLSRFVLVKIFLWIEGDSGLNVV